MIENQDAPEGGPYFTEYERLENVPQEKLKRIKDTMFANHYTQDVLAELTKCLRVFPHD